jgi:hypothetical protein
VQGLALLLPFLILCVAAALVMPTTPGEALDSSRLVIIAAVAFLGLFGMFVVALALMFATPALVLDGEGPLQSIGTSLKLVFGHVGAVLARVFAFLFLSIVMLIALTMPTQILESVSSLSGGPVLAMKVAMVIWSSAVATLYFPFGVASLTVLYRTLVPNPGDARGAPVPLDEEFRPAAAARVPFE